MTLRTKTYGSREWSQRDGQGNSQLLKDTSCIRQLLDGRANITRIAVSSILTDIMRRGTGRVVCLGIDTELYFIRQLLPLVQNSMESKQTVSRDEEDG